MKTIAITFAGRKIFMEILFPYIEKYKEHIDEYHIYAATKNSEDIKYIQDFANKNKFVKVFMAEEGRDPIYLWNECYKNSQDENCIYVKLDDDIVFIDEFLFTDFVKFRKENPEYPIIYPMIINNLYTSWILQNEMDIEFEGKTYFNERWETVKSKVETHLKSKGIPERLTEVIPEEFILCPIGWGDVNFAKSVHEKFLNCLESGDISVFKKNNKTVSGRILYGSPPISINCCSWLGSSMKEYTSLYGHVWQDELWLSVYLPVLSGNPNYVYYDSVVSHFSYYKQMKDGILESNILERYKKIKDKKIYGIK